MPTATWTRLLSEINELTQQDAVSPLGGPGAPNRSDLHRRGKIKAVEAITGRPLVVYAAACTHPGKNVGPQMLMLDVSDKIGFKTMTEHVNPPKLDVLVHSPGGFADATETLVQQLRGKYSDIRFIVPAFAKSAATMLVMSGNQILMDRDAELGPIDPQMFTGNSVSPAIAILEQFAKAQKDIQTDQTKLPSWVPILSMLGPVAPGGLSARD